MKSILRFICGALISLFTILSIFALIYYYVTSSKFLLDIAKNTNYYEKANKKIIEHLNQQLVNEELKECVSSIVTEDKIVKDVNRMITSLHAKKNIKTIIQNETRKDIENALKLKLDGKVYDSKSLDNLVDTLTVSYMKDIFPYTEYSKLQSKLIPVKYLLPISFFLFLMLCLFILFSILLKKERSLEILYKANFFSGILLICPFCFCHLYQLFKNFYYSNTYFSLYIRKTFYTLIDLLGIIGITIILITFILELINIKARKEN